MAKSLIRKLAVPVLATALAVSSIAGCGGKEEVKNDLKMQEFKKYSEKSGFSIGQISQFYAEQIPLDSVLAYDKRFRFNYFASESIQSEITIISLWRDKITPGVANKYSKGFDAGDIRGLNYWDITPEIANSYDSSFSPSSINNLLRLNISGDKAKKYDKRFSIKEITDFAEEGITPEKANNFNKRFYSWEIIELNERKIPANIANQYREHFSSVDITFLHENKIPSEVANSFSNQFFSDEIITLYRSNVPIEEANKIVELNQKFGANIDAEDILWFRKQGLSFEKIEQSTLDAMIKDKIAR